jgi:hypothetical protein
MNNPQFKAMEFFQWLQCDISPHFLQSIGISDKYHPHEDASLWFHRVSGSTQESIFDAYKGYYYGNKDLTLPEIVELVEKLVSFYDDYMDLSRYMEINKEFDRIFPKHLSSGLRFEGERQVNYPTHYFICKYNQSDKRYQNLSCLMNMMDPCNQSIFLRWLYQKY